MKKRYEAPRITPFPVRCHITTLSGEPPEGVDRARRGLLLAGGWMLSGGGALLYGGSDAGPAPGAAAFRAYQEENGE